MSTITTTFGSITINGERFDYDVIVRLSGDVEKRKKKLSKKVFGTSHTISLEEIQYVYEKGAKQLIVGAGHDGCVELSGEAEKYLEDRGCAVLLEPTPEAAQSLERAKKGTIALIHVTC